MKLSNKHTNFIILIKRSPDLGDGWRKVSNMLQAFFTGVIDEHPELYETKEENSIFYVRLSERGQILGDYV